MAITTNLNVFCSKCEKDMDVSFDDISYDEEGTEDKMGRRIEFFGEAEFECLTKDCNNEITIKHNYTEYPEGSFTDGDILIEDPNK